MSTTKPAPAVWPGQHQDPTQGTAAGEVSPAVEPAGLVAGIEERQSERDRLLGICQQLRARHQCPGRCVLTGELRRGGVASFGDYLDREP